MAQDDESLMQTALDQARLAAQSGEVPIGALIFDPSSKTVVARARNSPISLNDPCAHAEILALRAAGQAVSNYRLGGLWLYVTLEPCAMCAGAISHARIARLIYGAPDPKGGAVEHGPRFFAQPTCHWRPEVEAGVLAEESSTMLKAFFKARRKGSQQL
ncbi:MAG: nucleoside deaminase [Asticcacaulis sp.]|nr:nucleoside deaminase [Asticcacaulis sp.]